MSSIRSKFIALFALALFALAPSVGLAQSRLVRDGVVLDSYGQVVLDGQGRAVSLPRLGQAARPARRDRIRIVGLGATPQGPLMRLSMVIFQT